MYEVQSSFTAHDREYLELNQEKFTAETEYQNYRMQAQAEIKQLAEKAKDKELELDRLKENIPGGMMYSHASGFSIGDTDADRVKN